MKIILAFGLLAIILVVLIMFIGLPSFSDCYTENYLLLREYIGKTNATNGGNCTNGCLMMDVVPITSSYILTFTNNPPTDYQKRMLEETKTMFYFANENQTLGIKPYSQIMVRWCKTPHGYRIRGVRKAKL